MDCRRRREALALPLHQAVTAAHRLGSEDPVAAIGVARTLASGSYPALLEVAPIVANLVADATDLLDDALAELGRT